jgi:hypothetical protein
MKIRLATPFLIAAATFSFFLAASTAQAAPVVGFEAGRIIDDDVFTAQSMNVSQIQSFLNSKVPTCDTNGTQPSEFGGGTRAQWGTSQGYPPPYTCLKDLNEGGRSAAQIIYDSAQQYGINPQVMIVLLQKEQGLVTDTWPLSRQYRTATGYGCPDTAACDSQYYGFTNQVNRANNMFRQIMNANPGWYTPYVMGNNTIKWNPAASCGSSVVNIETRATQALYNYTPYRPNQAALNAGYGTGDSCSAYGNRNFYIYFRDWFGSTWGNTYYTCRYGENIDGARTGPKLLRNRLGGSADNVTLFVANNTGTKCAEAHTWANSGLQAWVQHIGTNSYTFDPDHSAVISGEVGSSTLFFKIDYRNTASGRVEFHGWDKLLQHWTRHVATNAGPVDPTNSEIMLADTDGNGYSELYLVNYAATGSGMVEIHGWSGDLQQWTRHTVTNLPAIDPTKGRVLAADLNGDGRDEFSYIKYGDGQSGFVEVHTWTPSAQQWTRHAATNLPSAGYNRLNDDILVADLNGDGRDELSYVKYSGTSSGRLEVHTWSSDQQQWISHTATSSGSY